ncbi:MAG: hypothetical protein HKN25_09090, partial [Pyrinomonadaceae bacterium]|nr:hypothetical protein [Pyrinomonadaceae bacterium]
AFGGLRKARVKDGLLVVDSNDAGKYGGACCAEYAVTNTYRFDGKTLKEVGKSSRRELYPAKRIAFSSGKFGKKITIRMAPEEQKRRFVVGAAAGQTLMVTNRNPELKLRLRRGDAQILEEDTSLVAKLRKSGDYVFEVNKFSNREQKFSFLVTIKDNPYTYLNTSSGNIDSIYTNLNADKCKTIELDESGAGYYRGECKGIGGYKLEVIEGDLRQTINVIQEASGGKWELDFWTKVSIGFSSVGEKAEWRVKRADGKIVPIALIIRYNVSEPTDDGRQKTRSSLVVTKFDGEFVCITDVVPPMKRQNEKARELADVAASKPCLTRN